MICSNTLAYYMHGLNKLGLELVPELLGIAVS
jgi:hypothetical protein